MPDSPVSKPASLDKQVSKAFDELKNGIEHHDIQSVLNELNSDMLNMSANDWTNFSTALQQRIKGTSGMLPELTILETKQTFAKLADGGKIDQTDFQTELGELHYASRYSKDAVGKTSFDETLLRSFLVNDFDHVKDETTGILPGNGITNEDLDKAFTENQHNAIQDKWGNDAITQLEKNHAAHFAALADENMNVTKDSIVTALKRDQSAVNAGLAPLLDGETRALASDMLDDKNNVFDRFGDGDAITLASLNEAANKAHISVTDLQNSKPVDDAKHGTPQGTDGQPIPAKQGKESEKKDGDKSHPEKPLKGDDKKDEGWFQRLWPHLSSSTPDKNGSSPHDAPPAVKKHYEPGDTYKVRPGDNLTVIARHVLAEEKKAATPDAVKKMISEIAAKNGIENINLIRDGQVLHF